MKIILVLVISFSIWASTDRTPALDNGTTMLIQSNHNFRISPWGNMVVQFYAYNYDSVSIYIFPYCDTAKKINLITIRAINWERFGVRFSDEINDWNMPTWDIFQKRIYFIACGSSVNTRISADAAIFERFSINVEDLCGVQIPNIQLTSFPSQFLAKEASITPQRLTSESFPNPSNCNVAINFTSAIASFVIINIYDINGELIRMLGKQEFNSGLHQLVWDGKDSKGISVASGTYYYQVISNDIISTKKLIRIK
jgi:hypothetical protein